MSVTLIGNDNHSMSRTFVDLEEEEEEEEIERQLKALIAYNKANNEAEIKRMRKEGEMRAARMEQKVAIISDMVRVVISSAKELDTLFRQVVERVDQLEEPRCEGSVSMIRGQINSKCRQVHEKLRSQEEVLNIVDHKISQIREAANGYRSDLLLEEEAPVSRKIENQSTNRPEEGTWTLSSASSDRSNSKRRIKLIDFSKKLVEREKAERSDLELLVPNKSPEANDRNCVPVTDIQQEADDWEAVGPRNPILRPNVLKHVTSNCENFRPPRRPAKLFTSLRQPYATQSEAFSLPTQVPLSSSTSVLRSTASSPIASVVSSVPQAHFYVTSTPVALAQRKPSSSPSSETYYYSDSSSDREPSRGVSSDNDPSEVEPYQLPTGSSLEQTLKIRNKEEEPRHCLVFKSKPRVVDKSIRRFIFSELVNASEAAFLAEKVQALGGSMADRNRLLETCTHFVTGAPLNTHLFYSSVAAGKWVVCKDYIYESARKGTFLGEEQFEWGNIKENKLFLWEIAMEINLKDALAACRWRRYLGRHKELNGVFHNWKVLIVDSQGNQRLVDIIVAGGGTALLTNWGAVDKLIGDPILERVKLAFVNVPTRMKAEALLRVKALREAGITCVRPEYIISCLTDDNNTSQNEYSFDVRS